MKKGKSRTRRARQNVMRSIAENARHRAKQHYDRQQYDGHSSEGPGVRSISATRGKG